MALTKGEQLTLFVLFQLPTSQFRLQMEGALGIPVDAQPPGPPASSTDFHTRLVGLAPLLGIAKANLSSGQDSIYVGAAASNQTKPPGPYIKGWIGHSYKIIGYGN